VYVIIRHGAVGAGASGGSRCDCSLDGPARDRWPRRTSDRDSPIPAVIAGGRTSCPSAARRSTSSTAHFSIGVEGRHPDQARIVFANVGVDFRCLFFVVCWHARRSIGREIRGVAQRTGVADPSCFQCHERPDGMRVCRMHALPPMTFGVLADSVERDGRPYNSPRRYLN